MDEYYDIDECTCICEILLYRLEMWFCLKVVGVIEGEYYGKQ